jgi:hypothetical protein
MYRDTSYTFNWATAKYTCALREQYKKVFIIVPNSSSELLLYDFTKNVGDTVEVYGLGLNYPNSIKLKIDSISSTIINGVARKTYKFNANGSYHTDEYWYEGIGSSFGFLTPFLSVSDNIFSLKCNAKNDTLYYLRNSIGNFLCSPVEPNNSCEYTQIATSINDFSAESSFTIFPNPSNDKINVQTDLKINNIIIFNSIGQEVRTTKNKLIDIYNLEKGFYFIRLTTENNRNGIIKFIKE